MKKIFALVSALVLALTAFSAFAEFPSKTTADLVRAETDAEGVQIIVTENNIEAVTDLLKALNEDNSIPAAVKAMLPEGSNFTRVEEAATLQIMGGTAEGNLVIDLHFPTNFTGKDVVVFLGILNSNPITEWKYVEATGNEDGSVRLVLTGEIQDWLNGREFIALVAD